MKSKTSFIGIRKYLTTGMGVDRELWNLSLTLAEIASRNSKKGTEKINSKKHFALLEIGKQKKI